jgi:eukaryotic-like serine/threonine-protein kinase
VTNDQWRQVEQIVHDALAVSPQAREAFVRDACHGDVPMQREVESLLAVNSRAEEFLEQSALNVAALAAHDGDAGRIGKQIGGYRVISLLGAGGMGQVYRARDLKLGRDVALKVLPAAFTTDRDRLARFEREARVLASLNHPHIGAIYGVEEGADGSAPPVYALVLELAEGVTLADRLRGGPIPVPEALTVARQIADALEAAHDKGIIHRDLKPANIKITPDGTVKVLDFGLAKAAESGIAAPDLSALPTLTVDATRDGTLLGTAGYMSPEQARGQPVDKRADIWAFGAVMLEMLTGRPVFGADTMSDTIAAVLTREPDLGALPAGTPSFLRPLLKRCLERDPKLRLRDIGEARVALAQPVGEERPDRPVSTAPIASRVAIVGLAAALMLAVIWLAATVAGNRSSSTRPAQGMIHFPVLVPEGEIPAEVKISPNGRYVAILTVGTRPGIWIRRLDSSDTTLFTDTAEARSVFWAPDSKSLGVIGRNRKLWKGDLSSRSLVEWSSGADGDIDAGGAWSASGVVLFGTGSSIRRMPDSGGSTTEVALDDGKGANAWRGKPQFLPDGNHFLYFVRTSGGPGEIRVGSLDSKQTTLVGRADSAAVFSPEGYVVFLRGTTLVAQKFDPKTFTLADTAVDIAPDAAPGMLTSAPNFDISGNGILTYLRTRAGYDGKLVWFDRSGNELGSVPQPAGIEHLNPSLSRDGKRLAVNRMDPVTGNWDIWTIELDTGIPTRVTTDPAQDSDAVWSPDGTEVVFVSNRNGEYGLYRKSLTGSGTEERILTAGSEPRATDWTRDRAFVIYEVDGNVMALPMTGSDRTPRPIATSAFPEYGASTSPDSRWIAYAAGDTGEFQVYVQAFPDGGLKKRVSSVFGIHPRWRGDGRELFYWQPPLGLMAVELSYDAAGVHAQAPKPALPAHVNILNLIDHRHHHAVSADGKRFLLRLSAGPPAPPINVIVNWTEALSKRD